MEDDDPFGMGPPPPLAEPAADADPFGMPAADDALPTFEDVATPAAEPDAAPPAAPDMSGGMDMGGGMGDMSGGMDMGNGMGDMSGGMGGGGMSASDFGGAMEMGPVAQWRIEQQEKVSAKAEVARAAEAAKIAEAQTALQQFYAERTETVTKRAAENRQAEKVYVEERDAAMIADSWDSVCKLVDLKEKAGAEKDTSRMRGLLAQLKHA